MKIEHAKSEFQPVTITLESQEELDFFTEIFYRVGGSRYNDTCSGVYALLNKVGGEASDSDDQVRGEIILTNPK